MVQEIRLPYSVHAVYLFVTLSSWFIQSKQHTLNRKVGSLVPVYSSMFCNILFFYFLQMPFFLLGSLPFPIFCPFWVVCLTAIPYPCCIGFHLTIMSLLFRSPYFFVPWVTWDCGYYCLNHCFVLFPMSLKMSLSCCIMSLSGRFSVCWLINSHCTASLVLATDEGCRPKCLATKLFLAANFMASVH